MFLTHLSLTNFRNYGRLELPLPAGAIVLHGDNAQGKTNILEAIYYLATTRSPHADQDQQLINWSADETAGPLVVGRLVAQLSTAGDRREIELRLIKETQPGQVSFRREALVNRRKVRLMDLLGNLRVVMFMPQDIQLITGPPAARRRYLDITLCQTDASYCRHLSAYNKVLEQRNAQLRQIAEEGRGRDVLPVFTDRLVRHGSPVLRRRAVFLAELARRSSRIHYEELTEQQETLRLFYLPRLTPNGRRASDNGAVDQMIELAGWLADQADDETAVADLFRATLEENREQDISRATTTIGPHRDDWYFTVNGRELGSYGSRGQQRTAMLALKMSEILWMAAETGDQPILLLDEVLAELDEKRRLALLHYARGAGQTFLTATSLDLFTGSFLGQATTMRVANGRIHLDEARQAT